MCIITNDCTVIRKLHKVELVTKAIILNTLVF